MKKYFTLIIAMIIFLLSLVNAWFLDQIVDRSVFWGFVPSVLLCILFIICLVDSIKDIKRYKSSLAITSIILLVVNVIVLIVIPFRDIRVKVDMKIFAEERQYLLDGIKDYKIIPDDNGIVKINSMYSGISSNRTIRVYENDDDGNLTVGFYVSESMPLKSAMLIYTTNGAYSLKDKLDIKSDIDIKEIKDNWYYIEYKK